VDAGVDGRIDGLAELDHDPLLALGEDPHPSGS
jgi:hypothetical protein